MASIQHGNIEIDSAESIERFGEWVKFIDNEGASFLVDPDVVRMLYEFLRNDGTTEMG